MNDMRTTAIALHEAFVSYQAAGFTRDESLKLIIAHIQASTNGANE